MSKLKKIRTKNNFTHQNMADFLGISKAFYWQLENKKRKLSYHMALRIAEVFNQKPDDIFYEDYKKEGK